MEYEDFSPPVNGRAGSAPEAPGEFTKSLRAGAYGAGSQLVSLGAAIGETKDMARDGVVSERTRSQLAYAKELQAHAQENAPRIGSYHQVLDSPTLRDGLRNAGDYVTGLVGSSLPVMTAGVLGGLATGGRGAIPAMLGATAATAPFEMGDIAQKQNADPEAMKAPASTRFRDMAVGGLASAGVQSLVPGLVGRQILGKAASSVGKRSLGGILAHNAMDIPLEGLTEGAGEFIKQHASNQNAPKDWEAIKENAVGGAAAGGAFAGIGAGADLAHSRAGSVVDAARALPGSISDRLAQTKAATTKASDTVAQEAPKKFTSVMDDLSSMLGKSRESTDDGTDKLRDGTPFGDLKDFATEQGQALSDSAAVKKMQEIGGQMLNSTGLSPERRQQVTDALATAGERTSQVTMAGLAQAYHAGQSALAKVKALRESFARRDVDVDATDITNARIGNGDIADVAPIKNSNDFSGANRAIADQITPLLARSQPELAGNPEAMHDLADSARSAVTTLPLHPLSADTTFRLIDALGADTAATLEIAYQAVGDRSPAQAKNFNKNLNEIADLQQRSATLQEFVGGALVPASQGLIKTGQLGELTRLLVARARGEGVDPNAGPHQRAAEDRNFRTLMAEHFGDKADAVSLKIEKEAKLRDKQNQLAKSLKSSDEQLVHNPRQFDEDGNPLEAGEIDSARFGLTPPDAKGKSHSMRDGAAMLEGSQYAKQHLLNLEEKYKSPEGAEPKYDVRFEKLPDSDHGHIVVERNGAASEDEFGISDLEDMTHDTHKYPNSPSRLKIDGMNIDAVKVAKVMGKKEGYNFEAQKAEPSIYRLADMFKRGIAQLSYQFDRAIDVNDEAVIGFVGGKPLAWGDAKKLRSETAEDRMSPNGKEKLAVLRENLKGATGDERANIIDAARKLIDFEKDRELGNGDVVGDNVRAQAMGRLEKDHAKHVANVEAKGWRSDRVKTDMGTKPFEERNTAFDKDGGITKGAALELLQGRTEIGKDENVTRVAATMGDGEMINRSNMDGSGHNASDKNTVNVNYLKTAAEDWAKSNSAPAKAIAARTEVLIKNFGKMAEADQRRLASLGGEAATSKYREIPAASAAEASGIVNVLAKKYKGVMEKLPVEVEHVPSAKRPYEKNPVTFEDGKAIKTIAAQPDKQRAGATSAIEGSAPSPKSLAAKKAALLEAASSSDPALLKELATSTDAKALQRAAELLASRTAVLGHAAFDGVAESLGNAVSRMKVGIANHTNAEVKAGVAKDVRSLVDAGMGKEARMLERLGAGILKSLEMRGENAAVVAAVKGGKNLSGVMQAFIDASHDEAKNAVARAIQTAAPDVKVVQANTILGGIGEYLAPNSMFAKAKSVRGIDAKGGVVLDHSGRNVAGNALLHEGVHAATFAAIERSPDLGRAIDALLEHVKAADPGFADEYGAMNKHEFVAEALSNSTVQDALRNIPADETVGKFIEAGAVKNAWDAFVKLVSRALGLRPEDNSALKQIMDLAGFAMKETADNRAPGWKERLGLVKNIDTVNARLSTLVQDPDVAYGLGTKKYSLMGAQPEWMYHGTRAADEALIRADGSLILKPSKNYGGKTFGVSFTDDPSSAKDYATRIKGGGPAGFTFKGAKLLKIQRSALTGIERELLGEWADYSGKEVVVPKGQYSVEGIARERALFRDSHLAGGFDEYVKESYRGLERDEAYNNPDMAIENYLNQVLNPDFEESAADVAEAKAVLRDQFGYVHFSAQTNGTGPVTPQQRADVATYLVKVLGQSVRWAWANILHAGDFDSTLNLIRLSIHALDPLSTAQHEALHAMFEQLRTTGNADITHVLEKAAGTEHYLKQMREVFKNEPAVLAQLENPEERAAYMYQLWAANKLQVGPQVNTLFGKIAAAIRKVLGLWSNDERALHILDHFNSGEYAKNMGSPSAVRRALMEPGTNQAFEAVKSMAAPLTRLADAIASMGSARLRDAGIPALNDLADLIKREHTDASGKGQGFIPAARMESTKRRTALGEALKDYTPEQLQDAMNALQRGVKAAGPEARLAQRAIQGVLKETRDYMVKAGVEIGDLGPDYFPRVWDTHYISKHQAAFKDMLEPYVKSGEFKGNVDEFIRQLGTREGNEFGIETRTPGMQFKKERVLSFIKAEDAAGFVNKDLFGTLNSYIGQATRRAEWNRRLGDGKLETLMTDATAQGATPEQLQLADNYLKGVDGTLGDGLNPHARRIMGNMIVYQNIRLLPMAMFSSLVDPMGVMVRGGDLHDAWNTFKRGMSEIPESFGRKSKGDEATRLAELVGVVDSAMLSSTMGDMYSQGMVGGTAQKVNNWFFRVNMMEGLTRSFRVGASEAAMKFIAAHAEGTKSKHSQRWINELGLQAGDVKMTPDGRIALTEGEGLSAEQVTRMHLAVNQWVDGAMLRPDAADKPVWMNDPHYALIAHLKQFVYSFQKNIIGRVMHEAAHGNYSPAMALASYVPIMMAADFAKGMLQGGGDQPEWKKGWSLADHVGYGVQRAGLLGVQQFGYDVQQNIQRGGLGVGALVGPTVEQFANVVQLLGGHKQFGPMLLDAMPANALYAHSLGGDSKADPMFAD